MSSCGAYSAGMFVIGVPVSRSMFPVGGMVFAIVLVAFVLWVSGFLQ